jgi:predicted RNA binding protein with dsRBD fold (UPF0201 family)
MTRVEVIVEAVVNPTESVEKVERAVRNVLGDVDIMRATTGDRIILRGRLEGVESLRHLKGLLGRMRIRDAARAFLNRTAQGSVLAFGLNKQAAYSGRVSFYKPREAPLGPIQITVKGGVDEAIRYLCGREP